MKPTERLLLVLGGVLLAVGVLGLWRVCHGVDFPQLYIASHLWLERRPMFAPGLFHEGIIKYAPVALLNYTEACKLYYPPSAAMLMLPLAVFPFAVAKLLTFGVSIAVLMFGFWKMLEAFAPNMRLVGRVWLLAILCQTITLRWAMESLQSAPLTMGLLGLCLVALVQNRPNSVVGYTLIVCCLKPILGGPFLALLLIQRHFRLVGIIIALLVIINGIGFLPVGGWAAVNDYRQNIAGLDECECNDPNPYHANSTERTDFPYLLNAIQSDQTLSGTIARMLTLLAAVTIGVEVMRLRRRVFEREAQGVLLAPTICLMLLGTYHHNYDSCLLLVPLALYWCQRQPLRRWASAWLFGFFGLWYAGFRPFFREIAQILSSWSGSGQSGIEKALGAGFLTCMLVASLIVLHRYASTEPNSQLEPTLPIEGAVGG